MYHSEKDKYYQYKSGETSRCEGACVFRNQILLLNRHRESVLFSPMSKKWREIGLKVDRYRFTAVEYLNQVWIIGGVGDGNNEVLDTVVIFDPISNSQITSTIRMKEGRESAEAIVYEDKLFIFGGYNETSYELNSVEMYSPQTNEFTVMSPMKRARWDFGVCRVGNLVYVMGGQKLYDKKDETTDSVEIYNLETDEWNDGVDLPEICDSVYACASDGNYKQSSKKVCLSYL